MTHKWHCLAYTTILLIFSTHIYGTTLLEKSDYPTFRILPTNNEAGFSDSAQNRVFISFGGPTEGYRNLVHRVCQQSVGLGFFTHIMGFTDIDLKRDPDFWTKHGDFIEHNKRGYGYWLWKPYLINLVLEHLNENDVLVYIDAGSTINPNGLPRLNEYVDLLNNSDYGVLSFQLSWWPEKCWTKRILLEYFGFDADNETLNSGQCLGGLQVIKKNKHSVELVSKWFELASIYQFIDDTKISNENSEFMEHRHDQSIYSLLVKKYGSIKVDDNLFEDFHGDWAIIPFRATQIKIPW